MRIRYNTAKIMAKAHALVHEQLVRDQQFTSVGQPIPHTPLRDFAYNLKIVWSMAKCARHDILDGVTASAFFGLIIVED